jgi:hypothetical protein
MIPDAMSPTIPNAYEIRSVDLALHFARLHDIGAKSGGGPRGGQLPLKCVARPAARADAEEDAEQGGGRPRVKSSVPDCIPDQPPRYVRSYGDAIRAMDNDQIVCACLLIMDRTDALDDMEGEPLCPACLQDAVDTQRDRREGR